MTVWMQNFPESSNLVSWLAYGCSRDDLSPCSKMSQIEEDSGIDHKRSPKESSFSNTAVGRGYIYLLCIYYLIFMLLYLVQLQLHLYMCVARLTALVKKTGTGSRYSEQGYNIASNIKNNISKFLECTDRTLYPPLH